MFMGGNGARLAEIARTEKDPRLRAAAIKSLAMMGSNGQPETLVAIYKSDSDRQVRNEVLNALFIQQNGKALVDLARAERDPEMKRAIVGKLSLIHSKESSDYMMEILK
jgi:HEAT repeat protein